MVVKKVDKELKILSLEETVDIVQRHFNPNETQMLE